MNQIHLYKYMSRYASKDFYVELLESKWFAVLLPPAWDHRPRGAYNIECDTNWVLEPETSKFASLINLHFAIAYEMAETYTMTWNHAGNRAAIAETTARFAARNRGYRAKIPR